MSEQPPVQEAQAGKPKAPREVTYLLVLAGLTGLGILLPWVSFGPIGVSGLKTNQGLIALAGALLALVPAILAYRDKALGRWTAPAAAGGGLVAAGMGVWAFFDLERGLGQMGGSPGQMGDMANQMFSGLVGAGAGLYLTVIAGVAMLAYGLKVVAGRPTN